MSKKILEISLSFFLVICAITILIGGLSIKSTLDYYLSIVEEQRQNQEEIIKSAKEIKDVMYEVGLATAVIALSEQKIIPPTDAENMIGESIETINKHSERLGKLAKYINDYRINQQRKRPR